MPMFADLAISSAASQCICGAEWSAQASVVLPPLPPLPCPMHLTLDNPLFMGTLSNRINISIWATAHLPLP